MESSGDVSHVVPSSAHDAQILPSGDDISHRHHLYPAADAGSVNLDSSDLNEPDSSQPAAGTVMIFMYNLYVHD